MRDGKWRLLLWTTFLLLGSTCGLRAQNPGQQRVLVIGIDGVRPDALAAAQTPILVQTLRRSKAAEMRGAVGVFLSPDPSILLTYRT